MRHPCGADADDEQVAGYRKIAQQDLAPIAENGAAGHVNRPLLRALGSSGILDALFPVEPDAPQASATTICLIREAVAYACTEAEVAIAMQGIGGYPILQSGSPHQRERWIEPLRRGDAVAAFALTEPDAGSDAASLALEARPDGADAWTLHGHKKWISNAPDADFYTTFARTGNDRARGITAFVVPADTPGLHARRLELIGGHPIGELEFDGVRVTAHDALGEVNRGFRVAMQTFDLFRPSVGAAAVGMAEAALDLAVEHAANRSAFGEPLGRRQSVAHSLAESATSLEASRLLVHAAASAYDGGESRISARSAMAKLHATECAQRVIDASVQLHGASGLASTGRLGHLYVDIRASRIYEGASEVQRDIIARDLFQGTSLAHPAQPRSDGT